jgi:hypothetical protein
MAALKQSLDNLILGFLVGGIFPPAVVQILLWTSNPELVEQSPTYLENICLLAIGLNGGLMWLILNKGKMDRMGRGILLANFVYVIAFVIYFYT